MRWDIKPKPKEGSTREKVKFAFLPVIIFEKWVWLERYVEVQTFSLFNDPNWLKSKTKFFGR